MKYLMAFAGRAKRTVDDGSTRETIGEDCRSAALSFLSGVASGWDKLDLALWLTGPYARATRHAPHGERVATITEEGEQISDDSIESLLTHVRGQILALLENASLDVATLELTEDGEEDGLIQEVVDGDGRRAWVPVDGMRMGLRDRVTSLLRADYRNAPYLYAELFVCHRCEAVVFDAHAKRHGMCGAHRLSGEAPRDDAAAILEQVARLERSSG